jgi:hypothetical protein
MASGGTTWRRHGRGDRMPSDHEWPNPTFFGASILCFSVDPVFQRPYFLLGKEKQVLSWGDGSERWGDFGGGIKVGESPEDAAAREFVEETLGVVRYFDSDKVVAARSSWSDISASLKRGEYLMRMEVAYTGEDMHPSEKTLIPNPDFRRDSRAWRADVRTAFELEDSVPASDTPSWYDAFRSKLAKDFGDVQAPNPAEASSSQNILSSAASIALKSTCSRVYVTFVKQIPWEPHSIIRFSHCNTLLRGIDMQTKSLPLFSRERECLFPDDAELCETRQRWIIRHPAVRKKYIPVPADMKENLCAFDSRGFPIHTISDAEWRSELVEAKEEDVTHIPVLTSVNADYLEKECLSLWSVAELDRALQFDGVLSTRDGKLESCRPAFLAVLRCAMEELKESFPFSFS